MSGAMAMTFNIQENINPHFKPVWQSQKTYNILKGGRNSFKSSTVFLKLVYQMLKSPYKINAVCLRKVGATIRDSIFANVKWAIDMFGALDEFEYRQSPPTITFKKTGSTFFFYGADDYAKLKSNNVGNVFALVYEETAEWQSAEELDQINITFMRQESKNKPLRIYYMYNPPRNPYSWINEWAEDKKSDDRYLVHESSYLNDELGIVTDNMLADIEAIKARDYDYYRYIYLGEPVGLGTNVYNAEAFKRADKLKDGERVTGLMYGMDTGHQVSATAVVCVGETNLGNIYVLDMYYYNPSGKAQKKAPSEFSKEIHEFIHDTSKEWQAPIIFRVVDSAEGGLRNQYYLDYRIRLQSVKKAKNTEMIDNVQSLLALKDVYVLNKPSLDIFMDEHQKYAWDEKTLKNEEPRVLKIDDHSVDAFKYLVLTASKRWKIKV